MTADCNALSFKNTVPAFSSSYFRGKIAEKGKTTPVCDVKFHGNIDFVNSMKPLNNSLFREVL